VSDGSSRFRGWLYAEQGDYHLNLDPDWSFTPTYLRKMRAVRAFIDGLPRQARILDAGCGEGVLVAEYRGQGREIEGLDLNYESESVRRGDVRCLPWKPGSFDAVLLLDVLEHLQFDQQSVALAEIARVLKPGGSLVVSVPNLANLNSRCRLLLRGRLDRADSELEHPGERPMAEYLELLTAAGFRPDRLIGVTLTVPLVYRRLVCRWPRRLRWLHDLTEPLAARLPGLALLVVVISTLAGGTPGAGEAD
jgi:SAM-dependent methyltransferase